MSARLTNPRGGITLIELLIAMAILIVILAAVIAIYFSSNRSFATGTSIAEAQANARRAMVVMERELRAGSRASMDLAIEVDEDGTDDANAFAFSTILPNTTGLTDIRYFVDTGGRLIREVAGLASPVAHSVTALAVPNATAEYLTVDLTVSVRELTAALTTRVAMRNP